VSTELIVAIAASVASVVVAIVSLIASIISNRQNANAAKAIEQLKYEMTRKTSRDAVSDTHTVEVAKALQRAIQSVQKYKDEIQLILSAFESSLSAKIALKRITTAREQLFVVYEELSAVLEADEARALHTAKNISLAVENHLRRAFQQKPQASELTDEERQLLIQYRNNLTDVQQVLRDSRIDVVLGRITSD
jgi:hypothetical protein